MANNFYCFDITGKNNKCTCPGPNVGPGFREITDYRPHFVMNEAIAATVPGALERDDIYRTYLQDNGLNMWKNQQKENLRKYNCTMNSCIAQQNHVAVHPKRFVQENQDFNEYMGRQKIIACKFAYPPDAFMFFPSDQV